LLQVETLTKKFGDKIAVDGVFFHVDGGEIYGLLGPNGAGKTTTLSMLSGLLAPDAGRVTSDGIDRAAEPLRCKGMLGVVPQEVALSTLLGALLATPEQASAVGWVSSMLLAGLGGCWWPSEVMPRWLWKAAHVFPTPWAMDGFHSLLSYGHGLEAVLLPAGVLLGLAAVFAGLGARLLRVD
jgi:hypothetical protein